MLINKSSPTTILDLPALQINSNLKQYNNNNKPQYNLSANFPVVILKLQWNYQYPLLLFLLLHANLLPLSNLP